MGNDDSRHSQTRNLYFFANFLPNKLTKFIKKSIMEPRFFICGFISFIFPVALDGF
jgi:hypothetical protein